MLNQKAAKEKGWQSTQPEKAGEMGSSIDGLETQQVRIADRMNPDPVGITLQCAVDILYNKTQVINTPRYLLFFFA